METYVPAMSAPRARARNPLTRSGTGLAGLGFLVLMLGLCLGTLPWTLGPAPASLGGTGDGSAGVPRYAAGQAAWARIAPSWWPFDAGDPENRDEVLRRNQTALAYAPRAAIVGALSSLGMGYEESLSAGPGPALDAMARVWPVAEIARTQGVSVAELLGQSEGEGAAALRAHWSGYALGTDLLGRSLLIRLLAGGGVSLVVGIAAAAISVVIGTLYGSIAGYAGGKTDAVMMRIVDILYGLPYILLVVLLAVASDAMIERHFAGVDSRTRTLLDLLVLLSAIGGVSWLTMARVVRGQVLSLKNQPFVEAARAVGAGPGRIFRAHLLPNLVGPIVVYATLTVPQAILQEAFLSFLGIGVEPPLPSWGNLAAEGLGELNAYRSNWWLLVMPCVMLGLTLLALNFVGEGLREALDPKRRASA
ncbi:MAG: ABC transporter permease [Phycisphaerales bacterium]|jgi:oligopeptide transport system permease protein|nr:ABC transporter permease [Phycisphaerales bacterium]